MVAITADPAIPTTFTVTSSTVTFAFDWPWFDASDIIVRVDDVALSPSAYAVDGDGDGGTVTLNAAVDDVTVEIDRFVTLDLTTFLSITGPLDVRAINDALARLTARDQDLSRNTGADVSVQLAAAQAAKNAAETAETNAETALTAALAAQVAAEAALTSTTAALASITDLVQGPLTIASDAVTVATAYTGNTVIVDTEAAAATDDLKTISGGVEGQLIQLRIQTATRVVTVKDEGAGGNIFLPGGDQVLNATSDYIQLVKRASGGWAAVGPLANNN